VKLPNLDDAFVPPAKITNYLLSDENSGGKAAFFTRFGFSMAEWELLAEAFYNHAAMHEVTKVISDEHGVKYIIDGVLITPDERRPLVRTVCFLKQVQKPPVLLRLIRFRGHVMIREHERVILTTDITKYHLKAGDVGVVVHIYSAGDAYEVEFFTMDGRTLDVVTVEAGQVRPVTRRDMMHVRTLESAD
jgi:hypothetical protein